MSRREEKGRRKLEKRETRSDKKLRIPKSIRFANI